MRQAFTGCGTALVTPFTRSGALDETGVTSAVPHPVNACRMLPPSVSPA